MARRYFAEAEGVVRRPDKRQKTRKLVMELKTGKACVDCKVEYPYYILEWDHVRGEKLGNIESIARLGDMELLLEEISKCDLVCGNCHKNRTWLRSVGIPRKAKDSATTN